MPAFAIIAIEKQPPAATPVCDAGVRSQEACIVEASPARVVGLAPSCAGRHKRQPGHARWISTPSCVPLALKRGVSPAAPDCAMQPARHASARYRRAGAKEPLAAVTDCITRVCVVPVWCWSCADARRSADLHPAESHSPRVGLAAPSIIGEAGRGVPARARPAYLPAALPKRGISNPCRGGALRGACRVNGMGECPSASTLPQVEGPSARSAGIPAGRIFLPTARKHGGG